VYLLINHFQYFIVAVETHACFNGGPYTRTHFLADRREISPRHYAYIIADTHLPIEWSCCVRKYRGGLRA